MVEIRSLFLVLTVKNSLEGERSEQVSLSFVELVLELNPEENVILSFPRGFQESNVWKFVSNILIAMKNKYLN